MRLALSLLLLIALAGCGGGDVPCLPWDDGCAIAARTAEEQLGPDWDAVGVTSMGCEEAAANRGGFVPDRCWRVQLRNAEDPATAEAHLVLTTDGDLVFMGEPAVRR